MRWKQEVALEFRGCNSPLKHFFLSSAVRAAQTRCDPMRFVCIGSFYYTAVHAKIIDKEKPSQVAVRLEFTRSREVSMCLPLTRVSSTLATVAGDDLCEAHLPEAAGVL